MSLCVGGHEKLPVGGHGTAQRAFLLAVHGHELLAITPLTLASRRILANSSTLDSIAAFHRREKPLMESTVGWAQLKLRFIIRRAAKWAQLRLQNRSPLKLP